VLSCTPFNLDKSGGQDAHPTRSKYFRCVTA
jgi:hypothetical protein